MNKGEKNSIPPQDEDENISTSQSPQSEEELLAQIAAQDAQSDILNYESFSDDMDDGETKDHEYTNSAEPNADQVRIQVLEEENARIKDHMVRALADAENTRKRSVKEREDASKFAVSGFAKDILSVADNLRRALEAMPEEQTEHLQGLINGIEATERELLRAFEKNGILKLEPMDELFDPNFHEVMFEAPIPNKAAGTIIQIIEPGYVLNNRILRPARVGIAKADTNTPQQSEQSTDPGSQIDTQAWNHACAILFFQYSQTSDNERSLKKA